MARILYGVMGDSNGHVQRARTIASELRGHEILFAGGGKAANLRQDGYTVVRLPMLATYYADNSVDFPATVKNGIDTLRNRSRTISRLERIIGIFQPDLILSDFEYFTMVVAKKLGIRSVSIDHQHFITHCRCFHPPGGPIFGRWSFWASLRLFYNLADEYLITSFFDLPVRDKSRARVFPPVIKNRVQQAAPSRGDHVLVYQTSPTFRSLLPVLEKRPSRFIVYGFGRRRMRHNIEFKAPSRQGFVEDLASCRYAVTNGGHNVISEALFLGKPVLAFPIRHAYEQFYNAYMLKKMGMGDFYLSPSVTTDLFDRFETNLYRYRQRIKQAKLLGNRIVKDQISNLLKKF